jgi:uncharacterized protein
MRSMTEDCQEIPLTLAVPGYRVPAMLSVPAGPPLGGVLLVPGSLYSDVNGDYPAWNVFPHVYGHLARQMAERGLVVYRFAKLGPGTGSELSDPEAAARIRDWGGRMTIARLALDAFRGALAAREISVPRFVLAGHSEGAVVVSVVARDGADADGVVLLSGPSVGILSVMREQVPAMRPPDDREAIVADLDRAIAAIMAGEAIPEELRDREGIGGLSMMPPEGHRYLRESQATNPAETIAGYPGPLLVVHGTSDPNLGVHHAERLRDAHVLGPTEMVVLDGLSHMFKRLPPGVPGQEAFGYPGETDPRAAEAIARWVGRLTVDRRPRE